MSKDKTPFKQEALIMSQAMLKARMSEREIAHRFGRSRDRVREMVQGKRRPDQYLVQKLMELARD